jgi:hypothetical protein
MSEREGEREVEPTNALAAERERRHLRALERLRDSLPLFAREILRIQDKAGALVPLAFNRTQMFLHERVEAHKARHGRVRVIIGKGRQTTVSTYFCARFYHRTTLWHGQRAHILTHEADATDTLFGVIERFQLHNPIRPSTGTDSAKELEFDVLDGGYSVGTARTKGGGRSKSLRLLHWSEVAHSPNAAGHFAGVVQAVSDGDGTEVALESTGDGPAGEYFEHWQQAEAGVGDYEAIFVPYFWTAEYARPVPAGFTMDEEEARYQSLHKLTLNQIAWRRAKIAELRDPKLFKQEYPASATEMFESTGKASYIDPELVVNARKTTKEGFGALVVGVDPARFGDDRFSVAWRRGRKVLKVESRTKIGTTEALAWLRDTIDQDKPDMMFIDAGGGGDRLWDILQSWGKPYSECTRLVNFGGKPQTEVIIARDGTRHAGPSNRRTEMWSRSKAWLEQEGGADLPDIDSLQSDAAGPRYWYRTTDQALVLEAKEDMRKRKVRSPDEWDAVVLTFAEPVTPKRPKVALPDRPLQLPSGPSSDWMGL